MKESRARQVLYFVWILIGVLAFALSFVNDPALAYYFMLTYPAWALTGVIGGLYYYYKRVSQIALIVPLVAFVSCAPAMWIHANWYQTRVEKVFLDFMKAEAAGTRDSRMTDGRNFSRITASDRRQFVSDYTSSRCRITHRDEFFGSQEIGGECQSGLGFSVHMREQPTGRWRLDVSVVPRER